MTALAHLAAMDTAPLRNARRWCPVSTSFALKKAVTVFL
jgi:hypothetical protein